MKSNRISIFFALLVLSLGFAAQSQAANVALQNATATFIQGPPDGGPWLPSRTIDGVIAGVDTSWAIYRGDPDAQQAETIVWETSTDLILDGSLSLHFALHHHEILASPGHNLGHFRLSYTTDDRTTFADGLAIGGDVTANWVVIDPISTNSTGGELLTILSDSSILVSGGSNAYPTYTVDSLFAVSGITGFRLEVMKDDSLPHGGPGRNFDNGNFHLSEFVVSAVPELETYAMLLAGLGFLGFMAGRRKELIM